MVVKWRESIGPIGRLELNAAGPRLHTKTTQDCPENTWLFRRNSNTAALLLLQVG